MNAQTALGLHSDSLISETIRNNQARTSTITRVEVCNFAALSDENYVLEANSRLAKEQVEEAICLADFTRYRTQNFQQK